MVIFRENVYKRDFLPFSTKMYLREKVLKETSYKDRFMGKVLKAFFSFSIKIQRFQNKVLLNKSSSFFFQQEYRGNCFNNKSLIKLVHVHVGVVCEYNQMYSYWFRPWLLSQPDSEDEQFEEEVVSDVNANQGASQSAACRVKENDLGSTLFGDFRCEYLMKLWLQSSK